MNYTECIENARPRLENTAKACPECNARRSERRCLVRRNGSAPYAQLGMENRYRYGDAFYAEVGITSSLWRYVKYPVFAGPVGAVRLTLETVWMM